MYHSCPVVVSGAGSAVCELTNQSREQTDREIQMSQVRCLSQSCITLTNCSTLPCRLNLSGFMAGTHQGFSVESGALRVYSEESEDQAHPWTIIRCG